MDDSLRQAVSAGHAAEVESLLQKGANAKLVDDKGLSLLHIACSANELKIVESLINHGADIDCIDGSGNTPLHAACKKGAIECAEKLLSNGAKQDLKNDKKKIALAYVKNKADATKLKAVVPIPKPSASPSESASPSPKPSSPRKAEEGESTPTTSPSGAKTRTRPKSMHLPHAKDIIAANEAMESSGETPSRPSKRPTEKKKKSSKHMSAAPKTPKGDGTSTPGHAGASAEAPFASNGSDETEKVPLSPSKLRGPSRESSRNDLEIRPSPASARRKSASASSRNSTIVTPQNDAAIALARTGSGLQSIDSPPSTPSTPVTVTNNNGATDASQVPRTGSAKLEVPPSQQDEGNHSEGATASDSSIDRSASKVGDMRALWEKKSQSTTIVRDHAQSASAADQQQRFIRPPSTAHLTLPTAAASATPPAQAATPTSQTEEQQPHANSTETSPNPKTLKKTTSQDSDSSSKGTIAHAGKISVSRDEYRKLKSDMTHYRRGYDHWKTKYKELEANVTGGVGHVSLTTTLGAHGEAIVLSRSNSASELAASTALEHAEIAELKRQTASLNSRNAELTSIMDALALKFKLTMENIGLRLDSIELQLKKVQGDYATLLAGQEALSSIPISARTSELPAGSRGSLGMDGSGDSSDRSSPRANVKRGVSQKELAHKRSSGLLKPGYPIPVTPQGPVSPSSSGSSTQREGGTKDAHTFWSSFLIDLTTLRRKIIIPLMSQPVETLDKRTRVVCEMLDTEQKYIFGIEVMITNWEKPLIAYAGIEPKIPMNELKSIFGDGWLQFMVANNVKYLCEKLEDRVMNWTETSTVGDIFAEFEPYLHPYKRYCSRYEESLRMLTQLAETNTKFKKALHFFDNHCFGFNGLRLRDYLITPVQRVPRYNLLLRDLLNCTPESHPDHQLLTNALNKISTTAVDINEGIRQAESQLKMREICERGNGFENLSKGNQYRSHIKTGHVDVLVDLMDRRRGLPNKKPELLIFNDLIVSGAFVNKKSVPQEYSVPAALAWIISDLTESPEDLNPLLEGCPRQNAFLIRGPESLWLVGIKKQSDLNAFMAALQNVIGCEQTELANGRRRGRYDFLRLPGTYDGQWADGDFHGAGTYVKQDGTLFDGHWDSRFKTGFGQITASGVGQHIAGWKNMRPDSDVVEYKDHHLWETRTELTERDWAILMTGARDVQYKKGDKVIEQGLPNSSLFKIKNGKCRVEKETAEGRVTLVTLQPGAYFGDTSVLPMMRTATADVICDTSTAEISVIEVNILFEILKTDPALAMRFFRQLARTLANRLRSLHQAPQSNKGADKKKRSDSVGDLSARDKPEGDDGIDKAQVDNTYIDKFDLPSGEVIIKEMTAGLRGVIKKYGHLFLSQHFLCFEAHVFGMASKEVIPLERISKVEIIKKKYILIHTKKSKFEFTVDNLDELHSLLSSMCTSKPADSLSAAPSSTHLHVDKSSDDTQTASSEDSRDQRSGSNAGLTSYPPGVTAPKRRTTNMSITVAEDTDTGSLTSGDWKLLQQGMQCITYTKDKPIIEQGASHLRLFQIARGKCRIEIKGNDSTAAPAVVGYLSTGALFGEISFLDGSAATASVIANDESVEVYVIEGHFINILFVKYPDLAGRFFAYLAGVIAGRLNEREATKVNQDKKSGKRPKAKQGVTVTSHHTPSVITSSSPPSLPVPSSDT